MTAVLSVQGLSKRFGQIVVADNLDISVGISECLGIIGPNGAGKTSMFNMIDGNIVPDAGHVFLDNRDITKLSTNRRVRLGLARAFQVPQPFPDLTAYENILLGATFGAGAESAEASRLAVEILEQTGLQQRAGMLAGSLSLLDRKRLELARALATKPRILLLDEVAGGLTEGEVGQLVQLINAIKPSVAIIWIEHVIHALTAVADRVVAVHHGKVIASGRPNDVMEHPAVQEVYIGALIDDVA